MVSNLPVEFNFESHYAGEQSSTYDGESSASERFAIMGTGTHELLGLQLLPGKPTPAEVRLERSAGQDGGVGMAKSVARGMAKMAVTPLAMMSQPMRSLLLTTKPRRGAPAGGGGGGGGDGSRGDQRGGGDPTLNIVVTFMPFTTTTTCFNSWIKFFFHILTGFILTFIKN